MGMVPSLNTNAGSPLTASCYYFLASLTQIPGTRGLKLINAIVHILACDMPLCLYTLPDVNITILPRVMCADSINACMPAHQRAPLQHRQLLRQTHFHTHTPTGRS